MKVYEVLDTLIVHPGKRIGLELDPETERIMVEKGSIRPVKKKISKPPEEAGSK